jgi:predicted negative regulator of RcsB-dependent stress response
MPADLPQSPVPLAEISQGPNAFEEFLDRNQKNLVFLAILLALGTAAFVVYQGIEKSKQETAGEAFNKAEDLTALQSVINGHAGTTAAQSAMILLADRQWTEGQQDAAISSLRSFIASNPNHPALPAAQASLGAKLMAQGKSEDAAKLFQDLADDPKARYIAPYALISLGDMAKAAGDTAKAETFYKRVKEDFSDSAFAETASKHSAILKAKPPIEIAPPPKPATPADPTAAIKAALPPGLTISSPDSSAPASPQEETPPTHNPEPEPAPEQP